jgi:hypothetical protein
MTLRTIHSSTYLKINKKYWNNNTNYTVREKPIMPIIKRHYIDSEFLHFKRRSR